MYQLDEDSPIGKTMKDLIFQMGRLEAEEAAREELAKEETAKEKAIEVAVAPTA
jgi:hypothetical protein